jgi:Acetyltransferase (GNAT) domain
MPVVGACRVSNGMNYSCMAVEINPDQKQIPVGWLVGKRIGNVGEIEAVTVDESKRQKGVGTTLINVFQSAVQDDVAHNMRRSDVCIQAASLPRATGFYEKLGFQFVGGLKNGSTLYERGPGCANKSFSLDPGLIMDPAATFSGMPQKISPATDEMGVASISDSLFNSTMPEFPSLGDLSSLTMLPALTFPNLETFQDLGNETILQGAVSQDIPFRFGDPSLPSSPTDLSSLMFG